MATQRILDFLADRRPEGPCLVVDLDVVRDNYLRFARAMPATRIFYAVKANPAPEVLSLLAGLGSSFDTASVPEIEMALAAGATPDRISFGNTIKKERDVARAHALGVSLFAVDSSRKSRRSPAPRPAPACSAASSPTARAPSGRCRASSAARPTWRSTCSPMPMRSASTPMASRSMSARSRPTCRPGTRPSAQAAAIFRTLGGARHHAFDGQSRRRLPGPLSEGRAAGRPLCPCHPEGARQAFRQCHPGDDHRAGPRHGRRCRRDQGRGRAGVEEAGGRRQALGLSRHRQVRRPRRDDGGGDPLSDPHARATAMRRRRASSPVRPATVPTCSTRRRRTTCRSR